MLAFRGTSPRIHPEAWLAPSSTVIGDVVIGSGSSLWFGTVVRGDVYPVRIGTATNLQDLCVVHVTGGRHAAEIGDGVTVGHRAVVHGCRVGNGALIGIGAVVLDGADVGEEALVAAGSVVAPGTRVPPGVLALGVPARVVRPLAAAERRAQREQAEAYVETARAYRRELG